MKATETGYELSTGKQIYANGGVIGICPEGHPEGEDLGFDGMALEGYDGSLGSGCSFEKKERQEIAEFMIRAWKRWAE